MRVRPLLVALVAFPSLAGAQLQLRDTTPVPRDLALALITMNNMGMSDPVLFVGQAPDPGIRSLFPRGARILGGMTYSRRPGLGGSHTTVLAMQETPDSAMNILETLFEREGLRPPPAYPGQRERGGFVSSSSGFTMAMGMGGGRGVTVCSDSAMIMASAMPAGDQSIVRIAVNGEMFGMCTRSAQAQVAFQRMESLQLPSLEPPRGAMTRGMGMGGGSDSREAHVTLESRISAAEMINHFVKQLEEQGWTLGVRSDKGELSSVTAKKTEKNETLHLLLTDFRFDARSHMASLRVWNPRMQM